MTNPYLNTPPTKLRRDLTKEKDRTKRKQMTDALMVWRLTTPGPFRRRSKVDKQFVAQELLLAARDLTAVSESAVGKVLDKYWNQLHDFESELREAAKEYDIAASYKGGPAADTAEFISKRADEVADKLKKLGHSRTLAILGDFDRSFVKEHGTPDDYAEAQRRRIYKSSEKQAANVLELGTYESPQEVAVDIEQKLKRLRYVDDIHPAGDGLQVSLILERPENALYRYHRGAWVDIGVKLLGRRGVQIEVDGDVSLAIYEIDDEGNEYFKKPGGLTIDGRKVFRPTDKVTDIVDWIDKVIRKDVGRDLAASQTRTARERIAMTEKAVKKQIAKVNKYIAKAKKDEVWAVEPDSTWETAYEFEPVKLSGKRVTFKYRETMGGKKHSESFTYTNEMTEDDLKWQFRWVIRAINKGYREDGKTAPKFASEKRTANQIAKTIAEQMGGMGRLRAMLGAQLTAISKGLAIKWPNKKRSKGNYVEITLRGDDTYDMEFFNVAGYKKKPVKKYRGIYFDQLVPIFEKQTGWYLRL